MGARRAGPWWRRSAWFGARRGSGRGLALAGGAGGDPLEGAEGMARGLGLAAGESEMPHTVPPDLGVEPHGRPPDLNAAPHGRLPDLNVARGRLLQALRADGVADERVLGAIARVPRERFVAPALRPHAYANIALPIGNGQTISQPLMVALMTQALEPGGEGCVLEIGTGSGYQTAVLAECFGCVVSVERWPALAERARTLLAELGYAGVEIHEGDGTLGWPAHAPYQRILVTAGAPEVPAPLLALLAVGGRMVIPVGATDQQDLMVVERGPDGVAMRRLGACAFVPLIGAAAWPEQQE